MKTPKYEDVLKSRLEMVLRQAEDGFDWTLNPFKSPIEKVLVATMLASSWTQDDGDCAGANREAGRLGLINDSRARSFIDDDQKLFLYGSAFCVTQNLLQLSDRNIRPDFAFVFSGYGGFGSNDGTDTRIIVELDGHDFHERTPEQAQSDKSRDRELQALGWLVLRFTGREVLQDPDHCLGEIQELLFAKGASALRLQRESGGSK